MKPQTPPANQPAAKTGKPVIPSAIESIINGTPAGRHAPKALKPAPPPSSPPPATPEEIARYAAVAKSHANDFGEQDEAKRAARLADIGKRLTACRFNFSKVPPRPTPTLKLCGVSLVTPGNIVAVFAQAKTGKTAFVGASIAALVHADRQANGQVPDGAPAPDCLSLTSTPPNGKAVIHFDTEQSRYDADAVIRRALKRAESPEAPQWLASYSLAGFSAADIYDALQIAISREPNGVHAIILDGAADFLASVNDEIAANEFVADLHRIAIDLNCVILAICHTNAGSDNPKGRGHLGSGLERKAETQLALNRPKENNPENATTVTAPNTRHAPLPSNPRFAWDEEAEMHLSISSTATKTRAEARAEQTAIELSDLAREVFETASPPSSVLTWKDIVEGIQKLRDMPPATANRRFKKMREIGIVRDAGSGCYALHLASISILPPKNESDS